MKPFASLHVRQMHQRRINSFYMLPGPRDLADAQSEITSFAPHEDRPRTMREMFADTEFDMDEQE